MIPKYKILKKKTLCKDPHEAKRWERHEWQKSAQTYQIDTKIHSSQRGNNYNECTLIAGSLGPTQKQTLQNQIKFRPYTVSRKFRT